MKVVPDKLLTNEDLESRVPTLTHMVLVGQANAQKGNQQATGPVWDS
jgi:hypothetical protein